MRVCWTEAEAKERWCPFARVADSSNNGSDNRYIRSDGACVLDHARCLGSRCMAWRWSATHVDDGKGGTVASHDTHGFCGLAGKP